MSLAARNALYFKYTITARFKLSPAPSTAKEVNHLLRSFQSIAPVEFFRMGTTKFSHPNPYKQIATVVFNASDQPSQLDPFTASSPELDATPAQLEQRQEEIISYIDQICGIPRYPFIEHDEIYSAGKSMVLFKHKLLPQGHRYMGEYEMSASTIESPFFLLSGGPSAKEVLPYIRHNFQRFHKIEALAISKGSEGLENIDGVSRDTEVVVNMNHEIETAALMDLDREIPVSQERTHNQKLQGLI